MIKRKRGLTSFAVIDGKYFEVQVGAEAIFDEGYNLDTRLLASPLIVPGIA